MFYLKQTIEIIKACVPSKMIKRRKRQEYMGRFIIYIEKNPSPTLARDKTKIKYISGEQPHPMS